jgi:CheY-like chemotaxis protein
MPITTEGLAPGRRTHPMAALVPGAVRIPQLTGLRIIVVDDDREATEALGSLLKSLGAETQVADSADGALRVLSGYRPDVIVSDIGMPGRDGLSLAREIRSSEQQGGNGHLPLVALTAYGRVEDKVEIFAAGFDSHVVKPVDPAELAAVIKSVVEPNRDRS